MIERKLMSIKEYVGVNSVNERPDGTKMSHNEKFGRVVELLGLDSLKGLIPGTKEQLTAMYEEDVHFNEGNIHIEEWRRQHRWVGQLLASKGINVISESDTVCVLKEAARRWIRE